MKGRYRISNDLKFCTICNNKIYFEQEKSFIFNCSDKIILFNNEADEEKNKKTGDLIIKIHPTLKKIPRIILFQIYIKKSKI